MCDFWHSSHYSHLAHDVSGITSLDAPGVLLDPVVYILNSIDSLADRLPKYVRFGLHHYSAMVLAQRYLLTLGSSAFDGELCCQVACAALWVSLESDGKFVPTNLWDDGAKAVFPCEVVHKGTVAGIDVFKGSFVSALSFDLLVHHPFETLSLLLATWETPKFTAEVALGLLNSLYRTSAVVEYPPYLIAVASLVGALFLLQESSTQRSQEYHRILRSIPVSEEALERILTVYLYQHICHRELPLPDPPTVGAAVSPSSRTGRTVSRQSSRTGGVPSTGNTSNASLKRKRIRHTPLRPVMENASGVDALSSLAWALLPVSDENRMSLADNNRGGMNRPVTLSELKILRELSRLAEPAENIIQLTHVQLFYANEEKSLKQTYGKAFIVSGTFDSTGTQFDSVFRLLKRVGSDSNCLSSSENKIQLLNVIEQVVTAVHVLQENKICHYGIAPNSFMIVGNKIKLASFAHATLAPNLLSIQPAFEYRAPELLMGIAGGASRDDPLAADLWSLGCLIAEIARVYFVQNRYEEPLFTLNDSLPNKPDTKQLPNMDKDTYLCCRHMLKVAQVLNSGALPSAEVWPGITKRVNFDKASTLINLETKKHPPRSTAASSILDAQLQAYIKEDTRNHPIVLEIVRALLRWCPERRASPKLVLRRITKFKLEVEGLE